MSMSGKVWYEVSFMIVRAEQGERKAWMVR